MKAWKVSSKYAMWSTVVFAETAGKAKSIALTTDTCAGCEFTEIEAHRYKLADSEYRGREEMDWFNVKDRLFLVKDCGWICFEPMDWECEECVARQYCAYWGDNRKEEELDE